jgi:hypothetical protein
MSTNPIQQSEDPTRRETTSSGQCPECNGEICEQSDTATATCKEYGLVVDERRIDHGQEWYPGDATEKKQVGPPGRLRSTVTACTRGPVITSTALEPNWTTRHDDGSRGCVAKIIVADSKPTKIAHLLTESVKSAEFRANSDYPSRSATNPVCCSAQL